MRPAIATFLIAMAVSATPLLGEELTGRAIIIDGDTIRIQGEVINLIEIDAPEADQMCQYGNGQDYRCGDSAHLYLLDLIGNQQVYCDFKHRGTGGRPSAVCYAGEKNLNREMVAAGWAIPQSDTKTYLAERDTAKSAGRGQWGGRFCEPHKFRQGRCR